LLPKRLRAAGRFALEEYVKSLDEFFFDGPGSPAAAFAFGHYNRDAILREDVR
jgi:hypothetical protein